MEQNIEMIREFVQEQFVSRGMIVDIAVHDPDPPNHNPHAHLMMPMRAMDENGKWLPKCHREYVLDENGDRIKDEKADGSSGRSSPPTGMTAAMRRLGGRPGRIFRTDTWKLPSARSVSA